MNIRPSLVACIGGPCYITMLLIMPMRLLASTINHNGTGSYGNISCPASSSQLNMMPETTIKANIQAMAVGGCTGSYSAAGFFSGTNCQTGGHVVWIGPPDPQGLSWIKITLTGIGIDGTLRKQAVAYHSWSSPNSAQYWSLQAKIKSSIFKSYSYVYQDNEVMSWNGEYGCDQYKYLVINSAYLLDNQTFNGRIIHAADNSLYNIADTCSSMGQQPHTSNNDLAATIIANIPDYTDFYISSHGGPNNFMDCLSDEDADVNIHEVDALPVANSVKRKSNSYPAYNLVYIAGCNVFGDYNAKPPYVTDIMSGAFLLGVTGSIAAGSTPDRAMFGWDDTMYAYSLYAFDEGLFADLALRDDLHIAIVHNYAKYQPKARHVSALGYPLRVTRFPKIYGDASMTLNPDYSRVEENWRTLSNIVLR